MRLLVGLALLGLVGSLVSEEFVVPPEVDYHNAIGISKAAQIKAAEEALDFNGARIVGGNPAGLGTYPYLGGLVITLTNGATSVCGSTLLSNTRAVTAAHCWRTTNAQARQFVVVLGTNRLFLGGTRVTTTDVEVHANYNMNTLVNDIAIIRMGWVTYNNFIRSINLASGTDLFTGVWAWAAGFGRINDNSPITTEQILYHVQVQVITNAMCAYTYGYDRIVASTLCVDTHGRGTCAGDSGGPLVVNDQLIGITSFTNANGCQVGHPAGFARVTAFNAWITARL